MVSDKKILSSLSLLYRICEAGEKGFATASTNIHNPGIKALFKSFAQQRAQFKSQLLDEIRKLGSHDTPRTSIRGVLHRGGFAIFAGMTIGTDNQERVVLQETARGEAIAVKTYERVLSRDLPPEIRQLVQNQYEQVRKVGDQVNQIRGRDGKRMVVRLFDAGTSADRAIRSLGEAGFSTQGIEQVALNDAVDLYHGKGMTTLETVIAGGFYGSLLGVLIGVLAGAGMSQSTMPEQTGIGSNLGFFFLILITFIFIGIFIGGVLAILIGAGTQEADEYNYKETMKNSHVLVRAMVDQSKAIRAGEILDQVSNGKQHVMGESA